MNKIVTCGECGIEYYSETIVPRESFRHVYPDIVKVETELADARADADHWKSECNALQRMVHEARAEIERKNEELDMFLAEQQAMNEIIERKDKLIEQMLEALKSASVVVDFYEANTGAGKGIGRMVKAAIKAERGEGL